MIQLRYSFVSMLLSLVIFLGFVILHISQSKAPKQSQYLHYYQIEDTVFDSREDGAVPRGRLEDDAAPPFRNFLEDDDTLQIIEEDTVPITDENKFKEQIANYIKINILASCFNETVEEKYREGLDCDPVVPRLSHMVWLYGRPHEFSFLRLLSGLSIIRVIKPCAIIFWCDSYIPKGKYWIQFIGNATQAGIPIHILTIDSPGRVGGTPFGWKEHQSSFVRLHVLQLFGGIYMDSDVIAVRSLDPLRCFNMTMGMESETALCNSFQMAAPNAPFLNTWIAQYY